MSQANGVEEFHSQAFLFTYQTATAALAGHPSFRGPGVFELRFDDDGPLMGSYSLFMSVERLP
jgi:hypothetical protein